MKHIITLIFLFSSIQSFSSENIDSLSNYLNSRIDLLNNEREQDKEYHIEIEKKLILFEAKEEYFTNTLGGQITIFSVIVTILLLVVGFVSYSVVLFEKKELNKRIDTFEGRFDDLINLNVSVKTRLHTTSANAFGLIAQQFKDKKEDLLAIEFALYCVMENSNIPKEDNLREHSIRIITTTLNNIHNDLKRFKTETTEHEVTSDTYNVFMQNLNIVHRNINDRTVRDLIAFIRTEFVNQLTIFDFDEDGNKIILDKPE